MDLFPNLSKVYTHERMRAGEAQRLAEFIAFGPIIFQVSRLMIKFGIFGLLRDSDNGMTVDEIAVETKLSTYAVKVLLEASLSIGTVLVEQETERFRLSKAGWFLLTDKAIRVDVDFNHDVNYEGMFHLEEAIMEGRPAGLKHFGDWPTIYEGLSQLPGNVQDSWFAFDHFYSDGAFEQALPIVFAGKPRTLLDVGGNTGRWALKCVDYDKDIEVTVMDLPQQLVMMRRHTENEPGADRIGSYAINLLDEKAKFPVGKQYDAIWMSQFLDCFGEKEIVSILSRATEVMSSQSRLYIMETFWNRQRYESAALCLTLTSVYFTAMANGNSKMYNSDDMARLVAQAGLEVEAIHDYLGMGHSIMVCKLK